MRDLIKQSLTDESGKGSGPRLQAAVCTLVGVLSVVVGFVLLCLKVPNTATYVAMVLGFCMGKSTSDLWAAQTKSAKVAVASASVTTTTATANSAATPSPLPSPPPSTGGAGTPASVTSPATSTTTTVMDSSTTATTPPGGTQ